MAARFLSSWKQRFPGVLLDSLEGCGGGLGGEQTMWLQVSTKKVWTKKRQPKDHSNARKHSGPVTHLPGLLIDHSALGAPFWRRVEDTLEDESIWIPTPRKCQPLRH